MVDDPGDAGECRQRALRLLALRTHFSAELTTKLASRGFDQTAVESTVSRLIEDGLVDDYAAGVEFVETRLRRKPLGPSRLRADLARRGLDRELADRVLAATYPEDEHELARRALPASGSMDVAKIARRLDRLGFNSAVIGSIVEEIRSRASE